MMPSINQSTEHKSYTCMSRIVFFRRVALFVQILCITCLISSLAGQVTPTLLPIKQGLLWGYMDCTGNVVIEPRFHACGPFSDGLAPARLNGSYGYIDYTGAFAIQPSFDYALPFEYGLAKVFVDGKQHFIDTRGTCAFRHNFKSIESFAFHTFAIVVTHGDKYGLIDRQGHLITDTAFAKINSFSGGLAVVTGLNHHAYPRKTNDTPKYEVGVIDTAGRWIVPYGRYASIRDYNNGFTTAKQMEPIKPGSHISNPSNTTVVLDSVGRELFVFPENKYSLDEFEAQGFQNRVAVVSIARKQSDTVRIWNYTRQNSFKGVLDPHGAIVCSDSSWQELTPFSYNRAFAQDDSLKWRLIDLHGNRIGNTLFTDVAHDKYRAQRTGCPFQDGNAIVRVDKGWCTIDTNGNILTAPEMFGFDEIFKDVRRRGDWAFFTKDVSNVDAYNPYLYGMLNVWHGKALKPSFSFIDMSSTKNCAMAATINNTNCYVSQSGEIVWKEKSDTDTSCKLDIDFMNRGYCNLSVCTRSSLDSCTAFSGSVAAAKSTSSHKYPQNRLSVILIPDIRATWARKFEGFKLYIVNATKDTVYFPAQDGRIDLKLQARNKKGKWSDIEYLPNSWCGNSYHLVRLRPNRVQEYAVPKYYGEFKTRIRAVLNYKRREDQKSDLVIYSNDIPGSINPGQFWNKKQYYPSGIMDPYLE